MSVPISSRSAPRPFADFAAAIGFLTLLPVGRRWPDGAMPRSVGWYPWVGWLLGGLAALPLWLFTRSYGPLAGSRALLAAACVVAVWALVTRFLHWDGLADSFDGLWGGNTRDRRLEIMRDSRIGSFGAAAMLMAALLQVAAATVVIERGALWVLVVAPVVARFAIALAAWELPSARPEGLGLTAMGAPGLYDRLVAGAAGLAMLAFVAAGVPSRALIIVAALGFIAGMLVPRALARPVGGMTGDLFGATVVIVEVCVLLVGAVA
jgi:adenosylcobinamide-GDP ribazoletransferase